MFKHILAPLDGTERAERALGISGTIARRSGGTVTVMRVVSAKTAHVREPVPTAATGFSALDARQVAREYVERVCHSDALDGVAADALVRDGVAADEIIAESDRLGADLIVISHRRHAPTTTLFFGGSVADYLMRQAHVPVLVLHADSATELIDSASRPVRALAPLDGTPFGEQALEPTIDLLRALDTGAGCALHLTRVIDPKLAYHYDTPETEAMRQARSYLSEVAARVASDPANGGIDVTWAVETDPTAVAGIERVADLAAYGRADHFDFIAMATHGREGVARLLAGSVTEALAHKASLPILVVHPRV